MTANIQSILFTLGVLFSIFLTFSDSVSSRKLNKSFNFNSKHLVTQSAEDFQDLSPYFFTPDPGKTIDAASIDDRAYQAIKSFPMSASPLVSKGLSSFSKGELKRSKEALKLAQLRDPRLDEATQSLLLIHLMERDFESAIRQLDLLIRINPSRAKNYVELISNIANEADSKAFIQAAIETGPRWAERFLLIELDKTDDTDSLIDMVVHWTKNTRDKSKTEQVNRLLVKNLISDGKLSVLKKYKEQILAKSSSEQTIIDDSHFKGDSILPPPLTWSLVNAARNFAEFNEWGGMSLGYVDIKETVLASQVFWLPQESRVFSLEADAALTNFQGGGALEIQIECLLSGERVFEAPLRDGDNLGEFTISPEACEVYKIKLVGIPGDIIKKITGQVNSITVLPLVER